MKAQLQATVALAKVGAVAIKVGTEVMGAIPDGITADEAERIATRALEGEDIKVVVKGVDIIDDEAQAHLTAAFARIGRNLTHALTRDEG